MKYYIGNIPYGNDLTHFGIKGMKWGVRRYQNPDGTLTAAGRERYERQMRKTAQKDAKRYAEAKMYYGTGAGNRRKLLKGELSKKMKDPTYKKYFDEAVENADYVSATRKAKTERRVRDTAYRAKVTAGDIARKVGYSGVTIGAAAVFYMNNKSTIDRIVKKALGRY